MHSTVKNDVLEKRNWVVRIFLSAFYGLCRFIVHKRLAKIILEGSIVVKDTYHNKNGSFRTVGYSGKPSSLGDGVMYFHDPRAYAMFLFKNDVGMGKSYMLGYWSSDDLLKVLTIFTKNITRYKPGLINKLANLVGYLKHKYWRKNTLIQSKHNVAAHYDLGNDFYSTFLDEEMQYSSGVKYDSDDSLLQASINKFAAIASGLSLMEGDRVLEIGCGWGHLAVWMADKFGVEVTAITLSQEQYEYAIDYLKEQDKFSKRDLFSLVEFKIMDYRELADHYNPGHFDHVVSIEMIEQVGPEYLDEYFEIIDDMLDLEGSAFIQAIVMPDERYSAYLQTTDFIREYIFPGGHLPRQSAVESQALELDLSIASIKDITDSYAFVCEEWLRIYTNHITENGSSKGDYFDNMWWFYLAYCAAGFREEVIRCRQYVIIKE